MGKRPVTRHPGVVHRSGWSGAPIARSKRCSPTGSRYSATSLPCRSTGWLWPLMVTFAFSGQVAAPDADARTVHRDVLLAQRVHAEHAVGERTRFGILDRERLPRLAFHRIVQQLRAALGFLWFHQLPGSARFRRRCRRRRRRTRYTSSSPRRATRPAAGSAPSHCASLTAATGNGTRANRFDQIRVAWRGTPAPRRALDEARIVAVGVGSAPAR